MGWALFWVTSTSVIQKKDDLMSGTRHSPMATRGRLQCSTHSFHTSLRLLNLITRGGTPRSLGSCALFQGLITFSQSTYPRLRREIFNCCSHVLENLGNRTIPSDHAAVRLVIQKPTTRGHMSKSIPSWMSKHPVFCSLLQWLHDDHRFLLIRFVHLQNPKFFLKSQVKWLTIRELSRKAPDSTGAKLLIASTASRAYRNRHLGTLMRCCEAWRPFEDCFDPISF